MKDANAVALGRKGGTSTRDKYGKKHFKEIAQKRWKDQKAKKNEAKLVLDKQPLA